MLRGFIGTRDVERDRWIGVRDWVRETAGVFVGKIE